MIIDSAQIQLTALLNCLTDIDIVLHRYVLISFKAEKALLEAADVTYTSVGVYVSRGPI